MAQFDRGYAHIGTSQYALLAEDWCLLAEGDLVTPAFINYIQTAYRILSKKPYYAESPKFLLRQLLYILKKNFSLSSTRLAFFTISKTNWWGISHDFFLYHGAQGKLTPIVLKDTVVTGDRLRQESFIIISPAIVGTLNEKKLTQLLVDGIKEQLALQEVAQSILEKAQSRRKQETASILFIAPLQ